MSIYGNMVGGGGSGIGKTLIFEDETGNQFTGVITENVQVFDATPADVKIGKRFVSDSGIKTGEDTKNYRVRFSSYLIFPNENFSIPIEKYDGYDYTKFQAIITTFNTTVSDSTSAIKIVMNDAVYNMNSNDKLSDITKNSDTKSVDLNIINDTDITYIVHYSTYKEE